MLLPELSTSREMYKVYLMRICPLLINATEPCLVACTQEAGESRRILKGNMGVAAFGVIKRPNTYDSRGLQRY